MFLTLATPGGKMRYIGLPATPHEAAYIPGSVTLVQRCLSSWDNGRPHFPHGGIGDTPLNTFGNDPAILKGEASMQPTNAEKSVKKLRGIQRSVDRHGSATAPCGRSLPILTSG